MISLTSISTEVLLHQTKTILKRPLQILDETKSSFDAQCEVGFGTKTKCIGIKRDNISFIFSRKHSTSNEELISIIATLEPVAPALVGWSNTRQLRIEVNPT